MTEGSFAKIIANLLIWFNKVVNINVRLILIKLRLNYGMSRKDNSN